MEETQKKLELIVRYFGDFSSRQLEQLALLDDVYQDWNSKINVISRKDMESLYEKHVLHSLAIAAVFDFEPGRHVLDLGTGGGFPGIPLAIFFPEVKFHLVDSIGKKIKVVDAVIEKTGLTNVTTQHGRAEEIMNKKFDVVVSRAVAPLKDLWTWSKPLLRRDTKSQAETRYNGLICLKGGDLAQEIADSTTRPKIMEIYQIFREEYFREKFVLFVGL